jgi:hypothetical protein
LILAPHDTPATCLVHQPERGRPAVQQIAGGLAAAAVGVELQRESY